jgi:hypothetical protein
MKSVSASVFLTRLSRALALAAIGLISSCVVLQEPLGTAPAELVPAEWDGPWLYTEGGIARFTVIGKDVLRISDYSVHDASPGADDIALRRWQNWYIHQLSETAPYSAFMALLREGNRVFLCRFDSGRIAELVTEGWLPGQAEIEPQGPVLFPPSVTLGALTDEHYKILFSRDAGSVVCHGLFVRLPIEFEACIRAEQTPAK